MSDYFKLRSGGSSPLSQSINRTTDYLEHVTEMGMGGQLVKDLELVLKAASNFDKVRGLAVRTRDRTFEILEEMEALQPSYLESPKP